MTYTTDLFGFYFDVTYRGRDASIEGEVAADISPGEARTFHYPGTAPTVDCFRDLEATLYVGDEAIAVTDPAMLDELLTQRQLEELEERAKERADDAIEAAEEAYWDAKLHAMRDGD